LTQVNSSFFSFSAVTDCKYYITGTSGQVTMPTSGSSYPALSTCIWTIEAPVGKRIQVQV